MAVVIVVNKEMVEVNNSDRDFLLDIGLDGEMRQFMSTERIKRANALVKRGLLEKGKLAKGTSLTRGHIFFYLCSTIYKQL